MLLPDNNEYNTVMAKFPIFLELGGRRAVVIGGGTVAVRKAQSLLAAGARVVVIAPHIDKMMAALCKSKNAELIKAKYSKEYLTEAVLVIAATNDNELNRQIYKDCQELEVLCNIVDVPELCDFYVPAIVQRGDLQIAVSTEGHCPAYAGHIRKKLEKIFTEEHGRFLAELQAIREKIIEKVPEPAARKTVLGLLVDDESFEYFVQNGLEQWRVRSEEIMNGLACSW
jgi:precorrin-2 dehydrogenase/sirohydrochlorin ferrochelatase